MMITAREWLCSGGGGHEDGEDGIRACTLSMESAIELMDEFAEFRAAAQLAEKDAKIAKLCEEFEAQRQARLAAENLVALTREEQTIITKLRTGKRLVTCNAVDRPHSFNLCNATEGHSFPKLLDEAELAEKERESKTNA